VVIEDDYDSEFRYEGRPTDSLQSMDTHGCVAFVGTFSKTLSPDLRLGYLIAPPAVLEAVGTAKHLSDWHTATPAQWALAKFIADGDLHKHIRRCHAAYAARRERIVRRFADDLSPWFELVPATAGIHLAALCRRRSTWTAAHGAGAPRRRGAVSARAVLSLLGAAGGADAGLRRDRRGRHRPGARPRAGTCSADGLRPANTGLACGGPLHLHTPKSEKMGHWSAEKH
jgi:DNA-binding transcriptional MocR family regulator